MEREWSEYDLRQHIRSVIAAAAPIKNDVVEPTSQLTYDLGYDSLGVAELVMMLECELEVADIEPSGGVQIELVADLEDLIVGAVMPT